MAHLKCDEHGRRVVAILGQFIHRNGDGSKCSSFTATLGTKTRTAQAIIFSEVMKTATLVADRFNLDDIVIREE